MSFYSQMRSAVNYVSSLLYWYNAPKIYMYEQIHFYDYTYTTIYIYLISVAVTLKSCKLSGP